MNHSLVTKIHKNDKNLFTIMAHGGLAQAGKVKNITPKVEKQERTTKKRVGRAHKRDQYNSLLERERECPDTKRRPGQNKQAKGKLGQ